MDDIKATINGLMEVERNANQPPRCLVPYLISADELIKKNIPEKTFLVSSFMPLASFGMVYAPRGIGKSWFAMGLAKSIAVGDDDFLGWQIHETGSVLFVDGEMSLVDLKERTKLLFGESASSSFHLMPSEQLYHDGAPICLDMPKEHEAILQLLEHMDQENKRPKLIVLDNLSTLRRGVNENDNSETEKLLSFLVKLRHLGYSVLVVHHTNKAGEQRGASILEVPMDYIIKLSHPDKSVAAFNQGACFSVEFTKVRNRAPQNRDFTCELKEKADGCLDFDIDMSTTEVPPEFVLLRAIAECDTKPSVRLLAKRLSFSVGKTNKLLGDLRKQNTLIGKEYILSEQGKCILHDYFPQRYQGPNSYTEYQNKMPF